MLSFVNDYSEGAHEQVLRRLAETNREQHPGYGTDPYCARAKEKIRRAAARRGTSFSWWAGPRPIRR